jgi:hypothetical protein
VLYLSLINEITLNILNHIENISQYKIMSEYPTLEGLVCNGKTKEAIDQLKSLIEDLSKEPLNNLLALSGRFKGNAQAENNGITSRDITETEANRIRIAFLSILSDVREEIQAKINFFKPIPRDSDDRLVLRDFIDTVLSKKYKDINPFSEGNTFIYFNAKERHSDMNVIIMVLKSSDISGVLQNSQLNRIAQLKHRNLIQMMDVNFQVYPFYIITEFVSGINLKTLMEKKGGFPLHNVKRLLLVIGDVMNTLRQKKFPHAGIRPSKILIDHELEPEISPFDILMVNDNKRLLKSFVEDSYYFAPEKLYALSVNNKHDSIDKANQFCLAALGYELLTGVKLFAGSNVAEILQSRHNFFTNAEYRKEKLAHPRLPPRMALIFKKMLQENPDKRYDDILAALREIERVKAVLDKDEERVLASYRRCLLHEDNFIDVFYENLFAQAGMLALKPDDTDIEAKEKLRQKFYVDVHLTFDVENTVSFLDEISTLEVGELNPASEYLMFLNAFIKTVSQCDPRWGNNPAIEKSWQHIKDRVYEPLKPYITEDFLKEQTEEILLVDTEAILSNDRHDATNGEQPLEEMQTKVETQFDEEKA